MSEQKRVRPGPFGLSPFRPDRFDSAAARSRAGLPIDKSPVPNPTLHGEANDGCGEIPFYDLTPPLRRATGDLTQLVVPRSGSAAKFEAGYWRTRHESRAAVVNGYVYNDYAPAYRFGWEHAAQRAAGETFADAEPRLAQAWGRVKGITDLDWSVAADAAREAWDQAALQIGNDSVDKKTKEES